MLAGSGTPAPALPPSATPTPRPTRASSTRSPAASSPRSPKTTRARRPRYRTSPASLPTPALRPCQPLGRWLPGLAGSIEVNANVDLAQGGDRPAASRRRHLHPGQSRPTSTTTTGASRLLAAARAALQQLARSRLSIPRLGSFATSTLSGFALSSVSWLQDPASQQARTATTRRRCWNGPPTR